MAMAAAVRRPSHLVFAVICLAVLHLLAHATTGKRHLVHIGTNTRPYDADALVVLTTSDAGWPACSDYLRTPLDLSNASRPRFRGSFAVSAEPEDATTSATATSTSTTRTPPPRLYSVHMCAAAVDAPMPAPCGATKLKPMLVKGLPLLAVPFLPLPVWRSQDGIPGHTWNTLWLRLAAVIALSSLAAPARAWSEEDCSKLTHASCAVYDYNNDTATVDRRRRRLSAQCEHPICRAKAYERAVLNAVKHGRGDDPLLIFCTVRVVKDPPPSVLPWKNIWITQLPVADPAAAAASGDRVCYVELVHLGYREGYYIRCPSGNDKGTHSSCTAFPELEGAGEIAAAVWEHRRLNYRRTVWPKYVRPTSKNHHEL